MFIMTNVHNDKSTESVKFITTNVHNDKSPESRHKMVITSKFHMHKLNKSAAGCVMTLLLLRSLLPHDVTTLDARVPTLASMWRWCGLGHRWLWNSQPRPNNVS
jgi:hypothetical protein